MNTYYNSGLNRSDAYKFIYEQRQAQGDYDLADTYLTLYLHWREVEKEQYEEEK
jgi:hypothetical protein